MLWLLLAGLGFFVLSQQGNQSGGSNGGSGGGGGAPPQVKNDPGWPTWAPSQAECEAAFNALPPEVQTAVEAGLMNAAKVKPFDKDGLINLAKTLELSGHKTVGLCLRALVEMAEKSAPKTIPDTTDPKSTSLATCDATVANATKLLPEPLKTAVLDAYHKGSNKDALTKLAAELKSTGHPAMTQVAECLKLKYGL